jgi:heptosyltransferase-3
MARLTVTVVHLGVAEALARLLASLDGVADEVVVVDPGHASAEPAVEVARRAGARVVPARPSDPSGEGALALAAKGDYVLELPGDAWLDAELAAAIRAELSRSPAPASAAYVIRERASLAGRPVRFGRAGRAAQRWLVARDRAADGGTAGAPPLTRSAPILAGRCERTGWADVADAERELLAEAERSARERYRAGARPTPGDALRAPLAFLTSYVAWLGLLDGIGGLRLALVDARCAAAEARAIARLHRDIGGARGRGPLASRVREVGRRLVVALAAALLPTRPRELPPLHAIRRILVVRADERVGNQLLTTPLLRALKEGLPHAEVHLLASARHAPVVARRSVDRVVPFEKRLAFRRPWRLAALLRRLRRERYDVVVEAGHWSAFSLTASLLARTAAAGGCVVGHARGDSARFLTHAVPHDAANANEVQAKLELLRPLGLFPRGLAPETDLGRDGAALASSLLARAGVRGAFAVLNPGARMADRRWPPAAHAAVARGLAGRGLAVLVVWGPGEEAIARAVAEASGARPAPPTSLAELAALLGSARLCVSNNSGPMHLAVAVGTPTVGIFLAGDAARWGHLSPIFAAAEPAGEGDAESVLAACDRLLAAPPQASEAR